VTLAGNVLAHIAETLAGIVLVQSVNKGAPGICGSVGSIPDLNSMNHLAGAVERAMINAAVSQMAQHFQLPFYGTGGTTDALKVDQQSAYESAMSALLVAMSGANYIHDIAGLMESDLTVSYDKLALDNEVLGMCQRVLRGIEVNDDTLATDLVIEKGPTKDYMVEEHTLRYMREEFYMPTLTPREKRDQARPGDDSAARARQLVEQLADADDPGLLDATTDEQIRGEFPEILPAEPAEAVRGRKARAV
jgi:trimethylamine--corrinoid protein Co-methyltransferase